MNVLNTHGPEPALAKGCPDSPAKKSAAGHRPARLGRRILYSLAAVVCLAGTAGPVIQPADIPARIGASNSYYASEEVDLAPWLGKTGENQVWDFSQPKAAAESVRQLDIVAPADGDPEEAFPEAEYAERIPDANGVETWSFYRIDPLVGRIYYGFYYPGPFQASPSVPFLNPTVDLPTPIRFGSHWTRSVDFHSLVSFDPMKVHVDVSALVDGSGTLVLPNIGNVPALRVFEVRLSQISLFDSSLFTETTTNLYWLVAGIGKAVDLQVVSVSLNDPEIDPLLGTPEQTQGLRAFSASEISVPPPPFSVTVHRSAATLRLDWKAAPKASSYYILESASASSSSTAWQNIATLSTNTWTTSIDPGRSASFYRVSINP